MGVEDRMCTDTSLEFGIVDSERPERFPGGFDQETVSEALVAPQERADLSREGKGHHEVAHG